MLQPRLTLHVLHASERFAGSFVPPSAFGILWSIVAVSRVKATPQCRHSARPLRIRFAMNERLTAFHPRGLVRFLFRAFLT